MIRRTAQVKPLLWLFISCMDRSDLHLVIPSLAWMAADAGAAFECYLEAPRDGRLFAASGSTVLGGGHHQQFNYLNAAFDARYILLGRPALFASSIRRFGAAVLGSGDSPAELYPSLLSLEGVSRPRAIVIGPGNDVPKESGQTLQGLGVYLFPEILYRRALAFPAAQAEQAGAFAREWSIEQRYTLCLTNADRKEVSLHLPDTHEIDRLEEEDSFGAVTLRVAQRWKHEARGLAFGEPSVILSQLADHCHQRRVAVYAPRTPLPPGRIACSGYAEMTSLIAEETARLAREIDNPVIVGRQTGDGDLFKWSEQGVCIDIRDPGRPPFPIVSAVAHEWGSAAETWLDTEPDDAQLARWADEGKVLATLIWHSGEVAHNEAMLNLLELASRTGMKMGVGVHAQRYETCPQLWELIGVPRERGGVKGLIEPVLHSGGLGVLAEYNCLPQMLKRHCQQAMNRIRRIAGDAGAPRGYYAFMDSDLATLSTVRPALYEVIESAGLGYVISSAFPGRNRIVHRTPRCVVVNQSCRVVHGASPFVRITTPDDLNTSGHTHPGWLIGALDAPVVAFAPYIWRHGWKLMEIIDRLTGSDQYINVLPHTVARYARLLAERRQVPLAASCALPPEDDRDDKQA